MNCGSFEAGPQSQLSCFCGAAGFRQAPAGSGAGTGSTAPQLERGGHRAGKPDRELQDALRTHKLENRCTCIPQLPNPTVQAYYHACDVFVNFNDGEIFGMSLLEAMYAGCRRLPAMRRGRI